MNKGVNHREFNREELADIIRTHPATITQLINLVYSLATEIRNLPTQQPIKNHNHNNNNSSTSKSDQALINHSHHANTRQQALKTQAQGNNTEAEEKWTAIPFQTVEIRQQAKKVPIFNGEHRWIQKEVVNLTTEAVTS